MVPRYTRPEMAAIWAPENRYRIWFEIEALAAEGMAKIGAIPAEAARAIREKGGPLASSISAADVERIDAIERETRHDVIAFLTWLAEGIGPESRFVHQGLTSSDVLDTCLSVQLVQATDLLLGDLDAVLAALKDRAIEHKLTPTIGRSHGIHAEPTSFGLKLAGHYAEFARDRARLVQARAEIAVAALSGAVGTFAHVDPRVEAYVAGEARAGGRAGLDPGDPARPARRLFLHAGSDRERDRAAGDRGAAPAAVGGPGGRGVLPSGPEGVERHAPQAQPGAEREPDRPRPRGARGRGAGAGERDALARARHQPFERRARDRPGRDDRAGLRALPGWPG